MESPATTHKALAEEFVVQINKTLLKWDANGKNPDFQDMQVSRGVRFSTGRK